jgi:hypothetical protein
MLDEFYDSSRDDPRVKVIELDNNKLMMKRTDPYGFISLSFERGQLPESLKGQYTTWESARAAVENYLTLKGREEVIPSEPNPTPKKKVA